MYFRLSKPWLTTIFTFTFSPTLPVCVASVNISSSVSTFASEKSIKIGSPSSESMTLSVLTSRWIRLLEWRKERAERRPWIIFTRAGPVKRGASEARASVKIGLEGASSSLLAAPHCSPLGIALFLMASLKLIPYLGIIKLISSVPCVCGRLCMCVRVSLERFCRHLLVVFFASL